MLTVVGHTGEPHRRHDLLTAWDVDPLLVLTVAAVAATYLRGRRRRPGEGLRATALAAGLVAIVAAIASPLEALSKALASAHMVQHVLLVLVAGPLLAWAAPGAAIARGSPASVRALAARAGRRLLRHQPVLRSAMLRWLAYVGVLWAFHSSALYEAALRSDAVHVAEHVLLLGASVLVWSVVVGPARVRVSPPAATLVVFGLGLQGVFLSLLLTFATSPWYPSYERTAAAWGVDPLADQHLAGVLMWIPAGLIHTGAALTVLIGWLRDLDRSGDGSASGLALERAPVGRGW